MSGPICSWTNHGNHPPCGKPAVRRYSRPPIFRAENEKVIRLDNGIEFFLCVEHDDDLDLWRWLQGVHNWKRDVRRGGRMKLGTLTATGNPVELTRFIGPFHLVVLQLTAETGYVQVGAAELLRVLLNPRTEDVPDPWKLLETLHRELMASMPSEISIEIGELARVVQRLGQMLAARRVTTATSEPSKP